MKLQFLTITLLLTCGLSAENIIISNQSDAPCVIFLPDQVGSNPVIVKSTTDSSPITTILAGRQLFISSPLVGTKAIQPTQSGVEVWDFNQDTPVLISRKAERYSDMHIVIDPVGKVSLYDGTFLVSAHRAKENAQKEFLQALRSENFPQATIWLAQGADINMPDAYGNTPLLAYVQENPSNTQRIIQFLLSHGAEVNAQNLEGNTPLYYCIINVGWHNGVVGETIGKLLERGADPSIRNRKNESARSFITNPQGLSLRNDDKQYLINRFGPALGIGRA